jgi:uncharacterized OB-fold protein
MSPTRPIPPANPVSAPYWDAARHHGFVIQRCRSCDRHAFHPRTTCPHCGARDLAWEPVSGRATVYTFTVARRPTHPAFADRIPYVIAIVELAEGPRLTTNIVGCSPDAVHIGMVVEVDFDDLEDEEATTLPVFRPANDQHR